MKSLIGEETGAAEDKSCHKQWFGTADQSEWEESLLEIKMQTTGNKWIQMLQAKFKAIIAINKWLSTFISMNSQSLSSGEKAQPLSGYKTRTFIAFPCFPLSFPENTPPTLLQVSLPSGVATWERAFSVEPKLWNSLLRGIHLHPVSVFPHEVKIF